MNNLIEKFNKLDNFEKSIVTRIINYFENPFYSSDNGEEISYDLISIFCSFMVEDVIDFITQLKRKAIKEQKDNLKEMNNFFKEIAGNNKIYNKGLKSLISRNYNLDKNRALDICKKNDVIVSRCVTFANLSKVTDGIYPANVNLNYLDNEWTIILNDGFKQELHILKIPANSFDYNDFYIRTDRNLIVLSIDKNFVDIHKLQGIENRFFEYKTKTISYSDEDIID